MEIRKLLKENVGKSVLVLGAGVTGRAVAEFLSKAHFRVIVLDEKPINENLIQEFSKSDIQLWSEYKVSSQSVEDLKKYRFSFAVVSPGFAVNGRVWQTVAHAPIQIISELDLAIAFLGMPDIAVTGTNGKTTTVHLAYQMLLKSGLKAELGGNVGVPLISFVKPEWVELPIDKSPWEVIERPYFVVEVSSYQLETSINFSPQVGVLLNIDEDHLERHGSIERYLEIKTKVYSKAKYAVINIDDPQSETMKKYCNTEFFSISTELEKVSGNGCWYDSGQRKMFYIKEGSLESYTLKNFKLLGLHNKQNLAAAICAARLVEGAVEGIQNVIDDFMPVEHRLEAVGKKRGVIYINDSKATNISSTQVAIRAIVNEFQTGKKIILLLGGQAKIGNWKVLIDPLNNHVKQLIGFGVDGPMIVKELFQVNQGRNIVCENLSLAVDKAAQIADEGDIVLLAPACASFDQYTDYTARGRHFRELVKGLAD